MVPARSGVDGNEDRLAKEAAEDRAVEVPDELRWEVNLSRLSRRAAERRPRDTAQWVTAHVRPERRYRPPRGTGLSIKRLRRTRKSLASRYCQLLSGHAVIGSFLRKRMTEPQRLKSDECWWCNCGKRQTRHHLFVECRAYRLCSSSPRLSAEAHFLQVWRITPKSRTPPHTGPGPAYHTHPINQYIL